MRLMHGEAWAESSSTGRGPFRHRAARPRRERLPRHGEAPGRRAAPCSWGRSALAACGIPDPTAAQRHFARAASPLGLASPAPGTTTTQPNTKSDVQVTIYLLDADNTLAPVHRFVQVAGATEFDHHRPAGADRPRPRRTTASTRPSRATSPCSRTHTAQGSVVTVNFNDAFGRDNRQRTPSWRCHQVVATVVPRRASWRPACSSRSTGTDSVPVSSGAQVLGTGLPARRSIPSPAPETRRACSSRRVPLLHPRGERRTRDARGRSTRASPARTRAR